MRSVKDFVQSKGPPTLSPHDPHVGVDFVIRIVNLLRRDLSPNYTLIRIIEHRKIWNPSAVLWSTPYEFIGHLENILLQVALFFFRDK